MKKSAFYLIFTAFLLSACGGADETVTPCSTETVFVITTSWDSDGVVDKTVKGYLGVPLTATPTITGIPATCVGKETFSLAGSTQLPGGLSLDANTGIISGTPTEAFSMGATGFVQMSLPGYQPIGILSIITIYP